MPATMIKKNTKSKQLQQNGIFLQERDSKFNVHQNQKLLKLWHITDHESGYYMFSAVLGGQQTSARP